MLTAFLCPDVEAKIIARGTVGFSGADLENLVNQAALKAAVDGMDMVTLKELEFAKDKILMGEGGEGGGASGLSCGSLWGPFLSKGGFLFCSPTFLCLLHGDADMTLSQVISLFLHFLPLLHPSIRSEEHTSELQSR